MILCEYGCEREAKYYFYRTKRWCCSKSHNSCPSMKIKNREANKGKQGYWRGKKHSLETRRKMSISSVGERNYMFGKNHTDTAKKKISESNLGERCGYENPNWRGGVAAEPYCDAWLDKDYKKSIKERDENICLNPSCTSGIDPMLHHIDYNKKNCIPYNLITLCRSCNAKANFNREWHQSWYQAIIYRRLLSNEINKRQCRKNMCQKEQSHISGCSFGTIYTSLTGQESSQVEGSLMVL